MQWEEKRLLEEKYGGEVSEDFEEDRKRLEDGTPLAYLIGFQPFLGLKIYLDSKPLIPRPETEWWTRRMTERLLAAGYGVRPFSFLDLCAGSGAIGCTVLQTFKNAQVYFSDIDANHETTIEKNIRENHLDMSRAHVYSGDLFKPVTGTVFDVIASNPPYIPIGRVLPDSVLNHESPLALFSGSDGLSLIRQIAEELSSHLVEGGLAWIECDSTQTDTVRVLLGERGVEAHVVSDQYGQPRVIEALKPR